MRPRGGHRSFEGLQRHGASLNSEAVPRLLVMKKNPFPMWPAALVGLLFSTSVRAWDYEGHRLVNQLALASLPTNFPGFVLSAEARERIAFLGGEADRWRNSPDPGFKHCNGPDHYLDLEYLKPHGIDAARLSPFRYEFVAQLAAGRAANPNKVPPVDLQKDSDRTRALIGLLPWTITEYHGKLKSAFSYLKEYESAGTPEEVANAQANIIYMMGVMGHFVGDAAQPLHTTKHHHGWVGDNPNHYSTNSSIHSWIDGGYLQQFGVNPGKLRKDLRRARVLPLQESGASATNVFPAVMSYLDEQFKQVEPLYKLEKEGKLSGRQELSTEGQDFITGQILRGAQMLGDLWLTAWQQAPPDTFLRSQLARRKLSSAPQALRNLSDKPNPGN
jgi:hypothetical protein